MGYEIRYGEEIDDDLRWLSAAERAAIKQAVPRYLRDEPARRSTHRKELDPNPLEAPWELRLGPLRVFYEVDDAAKFVWVLRAGRKIGNTLFLRGVAYDLREKA